MIKVLAIAATAISLVACGSMTSRDSARMGNAAETKNSTDANKAANPAATSPGMGSGSGASGVGGSAAPGAR